MLKPIRGTWFEFQHHSRVEGKYWNPICRHFTAEQWEEKVDEIASLGMEYLVLMCSSLVYEDSAESYFRTDIYPPAGLACKNPIETMLCAADRRGMKAFLSCGFYGNWVETYRNMTDPEVKARAFRAMEQMTEQFGYHPSFYGWYLPDESCIRGHFDEWFIAYINEYAAHGHSLRPGSRVMIAPYGTNLLQADDDYIAQLARIDADVIAYQDEVGVRKSAADQTAVFYEALRRAHDKAGRSALWADMEIFSFEGDTYRSALIPGGIERVKKQLESISPYVDTVLCYQYPGLMNRPGTKAFCGHPDSIRFYEDYRKLFSCRNWGA